MNAGTAANLLEQFRANWALRGHGLAFSLSREKELSIVNHPLSLEIMSLCEGRECNLPFFVGANSVKWCTMAPTAETVRGQISALHAWVIPSMGWEQEGDGFVTPERAYGPLAGEILKFSPGGYYRWTCTEGQFDAVVDKLVLQRKVENYRPPKCRPSRPSLYELRAKFSAALLMGNRAGAEQVVVDIDLHQLDSAANTQFMRIRMWHHFREFNRIANHPSLARLRSQSLPANVRQWIEAALANQLPVTVASPVPTQIAEKSTAATWVDWFDLVGSGYGNNARTFLRERERKAPCAVDAGEVDQIIENLEELFIDDKKIETHRDLLREGLYELLQDFAREADFPRRDLGHLYLALLRVWGALFAGVRPGWEESHIFLELASAALQFNLRPDEVLVAIQHWWSARKVPAQLPFLLDAIELLEREHPAREAPANLWIDAADLVRRAPDDLTPSEKDLWRRVGLRIGMDHTTIDQYLPPDKMAVEEDVLRSIRLKKVAIVCMRVKQASEAAIIIEQRTGAETITVSARVAGDETARATSADVVLFVWMASTHAVFRAFDHYDRRNFCYVQGTGPASIVRALERWAIKD